MTKYTYTPEMGEISGFGGGYEAACQAMVIAGSKLWDSKEEAGEEFDPQFQGFKNVYGIVQENNEDANALTQAVLDAEITDPDDGKLMRCGDEATGAMHQASIQHILAIRKIGWDEYERQMSARSD